MCMPDGTCRSTGLRGLGAYHVLATGAFWNGIILALLVLGQCGMNVFTGAASSTATRIGYAVGSIMLLCAFAAGYLFAPEFDRSDKRQEDGTKTRLREHQREPQKW